jgi:hypothetical protein
VEAVPPPRPAVVPPAPPADAPPPVDTGDCVVDLDVGASDVAIDGDRVRFCFDGFAMSGDRLVDAHPCYAAGLVDGRYASAPRAEIARPVLELHGATFTVCRPDGSHCKTIRSRLLDRINDPSATVLVNINDAGTLAAAFDGDGKTTRIETYALPSGERLATFTIKTNITSVLVVGETIVAVEMDAETFHKHEVNASQATLWTKRGKPIGRLGDDTPIAANLSRGGWSQAIHQHDDLWAFASSAGDRVIVQDIKTGKVARTVDTGAKTFPSNASFAGDASRVAIVFGGGDGQSGDVVVVDLSTDKVTRLQPARCPK